MENHKPQEIVPPKNEANVFAGKWHLFHFGKKGELMIYYTVYKIFIFGL
jgi:hypothetical protein